MSRSVWVVCATGLLVASCGGGRRGGGGGGDGGTVDSGRADGGGGCETAADCDDGVACTEDTCSSGFCRFQPVHARCDSGESCDRTEGCVGGLPCGADSDCEDEDPCTTFERCDPVSRTCRSDVLDGDGDGDPPRVCGGTDCDDSDFSANGSAEEVCDGVDNDCDGTVDGAEAEAECEGDRVCSTFGCNCPGDLRDCSETLCTDVSSDPDHCGFCFNACPSAATCTDGSCVCPGGDTLCGTACVDTDTDDANCGGCGVFCGSAQTCVGGDCTCSGGLTACGTACVDTDIDEFNCGTCGHVCASAHTCLSGTCGCAGGLTYCGSVCVNTATSESHCGGCFDACASGETCMSGSCVGICYEGDSCTSSASCGSTGSCVTETTVTYSPIVGLPGGGSSISGTAWDGGYCTGGAGTIGDTGTCTPGEVGAAAGCNDCAKCVDVDGTTAACLEMCTRSDTSRGGCRTGYTCDLVFGVCYTGCMSDDHCRIRREDTNGDGAIDGADSYVYDTASDATCSSTTGRCTHSGTGGAVAGDTCARSSECEADGVCFRDESGWPDGYCTKVACELSGRACAGSGGICHPRLTADTDESYCLKGCTVGAEPSGDRLGTGGHGAGCRAGYRCFWDGTTSSGTNGGCIPGNYNTVTTNNVGEACSSDADCYSPFGAGRCASWPGGACTIVDCAAPGIPSDLCGTGNQCVTDSGVSFCLAECTTSTDCRSGYTCSDHDSSTATPRVCYPT